MRHIFRQNCGPVHCGYPELCIWRGGMRLRCVDAALQDATLRRRSGRNRPPASDRRGWSVQAAGVQLGGIYAGCTCATFYNRPSHSANLARKYSNYHTGGPLLAPFQAVRSDVRSVLRDYPPNTATKHAPRSPLGTLARFLGSVQIHIASCYPSGVQRARTVNIMRRNGGHGPPPGPLHKRVSPRAASPLSPDDGYSHSNRLGRRHCWR